ncbi:hypothetical protein AB7783_27205 [Tardiphaga sp. 172_B4_N1_3]|uniref:hypothetical protein n=1 Tax=Tardiphaga sp. 172_B4_N1_3 TaxID=3240787 RepID=UPI003F88822B
MTRPDIELILEQVATWPEEAQEEFLTSFNEIEAKHVGVYQLNDEERAAVLRGLAEMRAGQLASEEEIGALFNRFR